MGFRSWLTSGAETELPDIGFVGSHRCSGNYTGRIEILLAEIVDMLNHPKTSGLSSPLNRFWWRVVEQSPPHNVSANSSESGSVKAVLEFVEKVDHNIFGVPKADLRAMYMVWDITPDRKSLGSKQVTIRWTGARGTKYLQIIADTMSRMTDELIETLTGTARHHTGGLSSQFLSRSQSGSLWKTSKHEQDPRNASPKPARPAVPSWPTPQDYHEAIQNPQSSFGDNELCIGEPELDMLGLPKVASGAFASVYRMRCKNRDVAVRCFLKSINNQAYRYHELSKFILADNLTYTVGFEFQLQGVRIHGHAYPILKMEWVEGEQFHLYLERIKTDQQAVHDLLTRFRKMTAELRAAGIAHGDLQHGNILVKDGELFLVDYDGMFVPSLSNEKSNELGHGNYQHPGRNARHFGAYLDNFSAWVIDTSLFAMHCDPTLWDIASGGDECLLFRKKDFADPRNSTIFKLLEQHSCQELRQRSQYLAQLTDRPVDQVPWLGEDGTPLGPPDTLSHIQRIEQKEVESVTQQTNESKLPDWIKDVE